MPTCAAETFIEPTFASLAAQTYPYLEFLIADDASSDRTPEICRLFAEVRPVWKFVRQEVRRGWTRSASWMMSQTDGDCYFVALYDEPIRPAYVSRLVDAPVASPRAVLALRIVPSRTLSRDPGVAELVSRGSDC